MEQFDLRLDVTEAVGLGETAEIAVTINLPDAATVHDESVVCFGKPGGGYSKGYFTADLPGPVSGAQAPWHAARGWVFVSVDHLGVGESTTTLDPTKMDYTNLAAAAQAAETQILARLSDGTLRDGFPKVTKPLKLGIGQSLGGCMTIIQQGRYHCYDGVGVLGYSAVYTNPPVRPGESPIVGGWLPRDTLLSSIPPVVVNAPQIARAERTTYSEDPEDIQDQGMNMAWGFHYDDVDLELVKDDLVDFPTRLGKVPPWGSATLPLAVATSCLTPGAVAPEAAAILVPVLAAFGERDVSADMKGEPRAYLSARSVDLLICPRMGHMHNFASTRELFWQRIDTWADWCRVAKASGAL